MSQLEQLFAPTFRGQGTMVLSPAGIQVAFAGRTTLSSGQASVTISTTLVQSGKSFFMGFSEVGTVGIAANSGGPVVVNSVVDGVSFALARQFGAAVGWDEHVTWFMLRT